jgi:hypothetical protein
VSLTLPFLSDSEWLWNAALSPAFSPKFVIFIHIFRPTFFSQNMKQAYFSRLPRAASCNCTPPSPSLHFCRVMLVQVLHINVRQAS